MNLPVRPGDDDDVSPDAVHLMLAATLNGLCRIIAALGRRHLLRADEITGIHEAMTWPLDDPDNRDDPVIVAAREAIEGVLAEALASDRRLAARRQ